MFVKSPDIGTSGNKSTMDCILAERDVFVWFAMNQGYYPGCTGPVKVKEYCTRLAVDSNGKMVIVLFIRLLCNKPSGAESPCRSLDGSNQLQSLQLSH